MNTRMMMTMWRRWWQGLTDWGVAGTTWPWLTRPLAHFCDSGQLGWKKPSIGFSLTHPLSFLVFEIIWCFSKKKTCSLRLWAYFFPLKTQVAGRWRQIFAEGSLPCCRLTSKETGEHSGQGRRILNPKEHRGIDFILAFTHYPQENVIPIQ